MLVLRTRRPFLRSRPGAALLATSAAVAVFTLATPFSFAGSSVGFESMSAPILLALVVILLGYIITTEIAKHVFYRHLSRSATPHV